MDNLWSTEHVLGQYYREILVWHHRLNHCIFKSLHRLSRRVIIPKKLSLVQKLPPFMACLFGKSHMTTWRIKGKCSGRYIRKPSNTKPGSMTSVDRMVYAQPGLIPQVTWSLTHARLWAATVLWTTTQITYTPIWWEEPRQMISYIPRRTNNAWLPPMEAESAPTYNTMEDSHRSPSMSSSGAAYRN